MNDDLEKRMREWGNSVTPEPDPDFAKRLEADLRSVAYFSPAPEQPGRRGRRPLRPAFVLGLLIILAGAVAVFVANLDNDPQETLAMEEAQGASVTRPGGASGPAATGTELPDGTIIEVGPDGYAIVGGIVLPPDSVAVIVDGHVEFLGALATPTSPTAPSPSPTADPTPPPAVITEPETESTPPLPQPTVEPQAPTASEATPRPTTQPTTEPTTPTTPEPAPSATPRPTPTATAEEPTPAPAPVRVGLRSSNLGPKRAQLTWVVDGADQVDRWRIRARRGDSIATVAVLRSPEARSIVVSRPETGRVLYWVVALDADGNRLATSNEVAVVRPRPADESDQGTD